MFFPHLPKIRGGYSSDHLFITNSDEQMMYAYNWFDVISAFMEAHISF